MIFRIILIFCFIFAKTGNNSHSLVGVDGSKQGSLPMSNTIEKPKINSKKENNKKSIPSNEKNKNNNKDGKNKQQTTRKSGIIQGDKPDDVPDFPQDSVEDYKSLFDDGFSNTVLDYYQEGEDFDVFVNQEYSNQINNDYISGNDDDITQMEVIEAEKKTTIDDIDIDKNNITTQRTRVMAYLTLDQMLFADIFGKAPHGYYVNAMYKKG